MVESKGQTPSNHFSQREFDLVLHKMSQNCFTKLTGSNVALEEKEGANDLAQNASIIIKSKSSTFAIELTTSFEPLQTTSLLLGVTEQPRTDDIVKEYLNWLAGAIRNYLNTKGIKSSQSHASLSPIRSLSDLSSRTILHRSFWQLTGDGFSFSCYVDLWADEWTSLGTWSVSEIVDEDDDGFEILGGL